jgi:hypothetical protein
MKEQAVYRRRSNEEKDYGFDLFNIKIKERGESSGVNQICQGREGGEFWKFDRPTSHRNLAGSQ